jgi:hypothetical protein
MLTEFTDVVALDITFEDVIPDDVSFEDSAVFLVEFDDYVFHPTKRYLRSWTVIDTVATGNLIGIRSESDSVLLETRIVGRLEKIADLHTASAIGVSSASGSLTRIKPQSGEVGIETYAESILARILDGKRRRVRAFAAVHSRLSLKGPLTGSVVIYPFATAGPLFKVIPFEGASITFEPEVAQTLVRIRLLTSSGAIEPSALSELTRLKTLDPASSPVHPLAAGIGVRAKILTPVTISALSVTSGSLLLYQSLKGDDDHTLYGDDDQQLGDTL